MPRGHSPSKRDVERRAVYTTTGLPPLHSRHKRPHEAFSFGLVDIRHRPQHPLYDRAPELLIFVAFFFGALTARARIYASS